MCSGRCFRCVTAAQTHDNVALMVAKVTSTAATCMSKVFRLQMTTSTMYLEKPILQSRHPLDEY